MKVTREHLDTLREALTPLDTEAIRDAYRRGDFPRSEQVQNLDTRYRWDLLWAGMRGTAEEVLRPIVHGSDYSTAHLDTALRRIVPPLNG